ncbi:glycoside hydrolase family 43 protein [Cellulomonas sp. URHD0024]|uniref:glycoside hydrolase family 43 protein n=1 Tax=Cellulomonas sp. URHD0024 TaxID=1302620 RepID=UPI0004224F28|nr:glycoside hydrolase family 43 protein [Cellulomonas sp. URHD0024]
MTSGTYRNPVWDGYFADPFVLRAEGRFWAFGTGGGEESQDVVGLVSDDLVTWTPHGPVIDPATTPEGKPHHWAPEVLATDDGYVLYYSAGLRDQGHRIRAAVSATPGGPYRDTGLELTPDEPFAIDPHPCRDADGNLYLFYCVDRLTGPRVGTVIVVDRMLTPTRLAGDPQPVVAATGEWQLYLAGRAMYEATYDWYTCEGAFTVRRDGRYWCLYSGGNWQQQNYGVSAASAPAMLGPWTEEPGELPSVVRSAPDAVGPGHASVVTDDDGQDWLVYHAWDPEGVARRMHIDPLDWTPAGPVCRGPSTGPRQAPALLQ